MKFLLPLLLFFAIPVLAQDNGTDQQLAQHYYNNGEFDKALVYYERLFDRNPSRFNFTRYTECLIQTNDLKQAEKVFRKQASKNKGNQEYQIMLAVFYERYDSPSKANSIYEDLIDDLRPRSSDIVRLYQAFRGSDKLDLALEALQKGRKILNGNPPLNEYFADYYSYTGDMEKMMKEYVDLLDYHSSYKTHVQRILTRRIDFSEEDSKEYNALKVELISQSQKHPNEAVYSEMLTWLFIQRKNFAAAFVHTKALDKRLNGNGRNVFQLGKICVENRDYKTAKKCFQHIVNQGNKSPYFMNAQNSLLNVSFLQVTTLRNFTEEELTSTIAEYEKVLERVGKSSASLPLIIELAHIEAFYASRSNSAIDRMNNALEIPGITDIQRAEVKMQLADIHVLHGDIWEAALFYSQVDKDFKYETIGHEAKFKNARIFYYDGEFDYAQSQLDVLKQSTSKLIANDALKLSLLITDNFGLDSNYRAMTWFANADLLIEQHQYDKAFQLFDSIILEYPGHSLGDEILLKKAHSLQLRGRWSEAVSVLEELLKFYGNDILADDALFQLGDIYETRLMNNDKARGYYRDILFNHKGSLYTTEARKRFQKLRGEVDLNPDNGVN